MEKPFNIILIEDDDSDVELLRIELNKLDLNFRLERVWEKAQLSDCLKGESRPDLIISDYNLPGFTGMEALRLVRKMQPEVPFILVSGFIGEEQAVDAMLEGASDFVMKDNLSRLRPAIKRELSYYEGERESARKLKLSKERHLSLIHSIDGIVWEADVDTFEFTYVSPQSKRILGFPFHRWYESKTFWVDCIHPEDRQRVIDYRREQAEQGNDYSTTYRLIAADGSTVWVRDLVTINKEKGKPVELRGLMIDITSQKEAERDRDRAYHQLQERIKELKCLYRVSSLNEQSMSVGQLLNQAVKILPDGWQYPEITEASIQFDGKLYTTDSFIETDWTLSSTSDRIEDKPLTVKVVYLYERPRRDKGVFLNEELQLIEAVTDQIALKVARIQSRDELLEILNEKDALLMEVHHRVKNNLAVVSGLMQLQAGEDVGPEVQQKLMDSVSRIRAIAAIHELLYQSESFSNIDFSENLKKMVTEVVNTFHGELDLDLEIQCDPVNLNVNQAIPCSLIVNEVVTNAIKHAFPNGQKGKISVSLVQNEHHLKLCIEDDGVGIPSKYVDSPNNSLGLQLIDVLSRQLKADYSFLTPDKGTSFILSFEKNENRGFGGSFV